MEETKYHYFTMDHRCLNVFKKRNIDRLQVHFEYSIPQNSAVICSDEERAGTLNTEIQQCRICLNGQKVIKHCKRLSLV